MDIRRSPTGVRSSTDLQQKCGKSSANIEDLQQIFNKYRSVPTDLQQDLLKIFIRQKCKIGDLQQKYGASSTDLQQDLLKISNEDIGDLQQISKRNVR